MAFDNKSLHRKMWNWIAEETRKRQHKVGKYSRTDSRDGVELKQLKGV